MHTHTLLIILCATVCAHRIQALRVIAYTIILILINLELLHSFYRALVTW